MYPRLLMVDDKLEKFVSVRFFIKESIDLGNFLARARFPVHWSFGLPNTNGKIRGVGWFRI